MLLEEDTPVCKVWQRYNHIGDTFLRKNPYHHHLNRYFYGTLLGVAIYALPQNICNIAHMYVRIYVWDLNGVLQTLWRRD